MIFTTIFKIIIIQSKTNLDSLLMTLTSSTPFTIPINFYIILIPRRKNNILLYIRFLNGHEPLQIQLSFFYLSCCFSINRLNRFSFCYPITIIQCEETLNFHITLAIEIMNKYYSIVNHMYYALVAKVSILLIEQNKLKYTKCSYMDYFNILEFLCT